MDVPIRSVNVVDAGENAPATGENGMLQSQLAAQLQEVRNLCGALEEAASRLEKYHSEIFSSHRQQIARLSVQIAEKILLKEISSGNYDIEKIVLEALKTAPGRHDVVVRMNPEDLGRLREITGKDTDGMLSNIKLAPDPQIGRAECVVETDEGIIEYLIQEHLERIGRALETLE